MRAMVFFVFMVLSCAFNHVHAASLPSYSDAIKSAKEDGSKYGRESLRRCVSSWSSSRLSARRQEAHTRIGPLVNKPGENWILVEIGAEGYETYDFILVDGFQIHSSYGTQINIESLDSGAFVKRLYNGDMDVLEGNAQVESADAPCYFVTVNSRGSAKSYAFKGPVLDDGILNMMGRRDQSLYRPIMKSDLALLIKALLDAAQGKSP